MSKVIVLSYDSNQSIHAVEKEKIILGRGDDCDIKLDNEGISRAHAAITFRFDAVYIENLSSSGQLLKDGEPIEYIELQKQEEIIIGPYTLSWDEQSNQITQEPKLEEIENIAQENEQNAQGFESSDEDSGDESNENVENSEDQNEEVVEEANDFLFAQVDESQDNQEEGQNEIALVDHENFSQNVEDEEVDSANENAATRVVSESGPYAVLKITRGEEVGREIKLDHGAQWTAGRGDGCEIHIDSTKLSRSHFKIVKISGGYRIQDLGSSNGTRLNGVAVSDAPLQVFDTIKVGPVEMQFIIVDPQHLPAQGLINYSNNERNSHTQERTAFAAPMPFQQGTESGFGFSNNGHEENYQFNTPKADSSQEESSINKLSPIEKAKHWWGEQPKPRRILIIVIFVMLISAALMPEKKEAPGPSPAGANVSEQKNTTSDNPALPSDISPEFDLKSEEDRKRIEELYVEAHDARKRRDWKTAFNASAAILDPKTGVRKYKDTAEILDQAQTYLNEEQVGTLTKNISVLEEAKLRSGEKVEILIQNGERAIQEGRWEDAQEIFTKAMTLDPNNTKANKGFTAAFSKNAAAVDVDDIPDVPQQVDPFIEARTKEEEEIEELQKQYQEAKLSIFDGNYRDSISTLNKLEDILEDKVSNFNESGVSRLPASDKEKFSTQSRALLSLVKEAKDRVNSEFRMEYQGQMSDAEVAISNKQYVQAREIFDNIIRRDPAFSEPQKEREKLYDLIISEAKTQYHEALVYESVGDLSSAVGSFEKTLSLLNNVEQFTAKQYRDKANAKLKVLKQ